MFDRYDPRDDDGRSRGDSFERGWGSRGGSERAGARDDDGGVFGRHVDLPRGPDRELVRERGRSYELNGRESEALATIAAFRVIQVSDVQEMLDQGRGEPSAHRSIDHLQESGLLERIPLERRDEDVVVLTNRGRDLLEANRLERDGEPRQAFYAGLKKPRELTHDALVYRACRDAEERLRAQGGHVRRVVLDYELKREYQQFLQERNRGRADSTGRPDRTPEEIAAWAWNHALPCQDDSVRFPDARIEFEDRDRQEQHRDIEVVTPHYRGAHAAAVARSGFQSYGGGLRVQTSGRRGGRGLDPRLAEEMMG
jgi:DNA-binding MarR family transcriptional regulator